MRPCNLFKSNFIVKRRSILTKILNAHLVNLLYATADRLNEGVISVRGFLLYLDVYESETELTCAYFNEESQAYDTKGLRLIYRDDSRGSCASQHTTAFSILAQMTSSKTDESEEVVD